MSPRNPLDERIAVAENNIEGHGEDIADIKQLLQSILKTINEVREERARDRGFFAGMCFAYGSIGVLIGAGIDYLLHR